VPICAVSVALVLVLQMHGRLMLPGRLGLQLLDVRRLLLISTASQVAGPVGGSSPRCRLGGVASKAGPWWPNLEGPRVMHGLVLLLLLLRCLVRPRRRACGSSA
jgi:hypothetical protein